MKKTIFVFAVAAAAILCAPSASKAADLVYSTATYGSVSVSTFSATRVDNISTGGSAGVMVGRAALQISNPAGNATVYCGFNNLVSSQPASGYFGEPIAAGERVTRHLSSSLQYWCYSAVAAASQRISIQQLAVKPAPGQ